MQLRVKTLLNRTHAIPGFTYSSVALEDALGPPELTVEIAAHRQRAAHCSGCGHAAPTYDHLPRREWRHVPLWGIPVRWVYAPRRVASDRCGVRVEAMPWNKGKRPWTRGVFLARWARRLAWRETAEAFGVSWKAVYRSVQWLVEWGLAHRVLEGITALGLDELHWRKGKRAANFLTVIYQVDAGCRRPLWVGLRRTERSLRRGLKTLGAEVLAGIRVVVSDIWRPYLAVVRKALRQAVQILDRFHLTALLSKAVDQVRRGEGHTLRGQRRGGAAEADPVAAAQAPGARAGQGPGPLGWRAPLQAQDRPRLDLERGLRPFLDLPGPPVGRGLPRGLDHPRAAQPAASHTEGRPDPPRARAAHSELVQVEQGVFLRRRGGPEQQGPGGHQTLLRLPQLPCAGSGLVSYARQITRTGTHPQILLTRRRETCDLVYIVAFGLARGRTTTSR
jgi:hypothetical protein